MAGDLGDNLVQEFHILLQLFERKFKMAKEDGAITRATLKKIGEVDTTSSNPILDSVYF